MLAAVFEGEGTLTLKQREKPAITKSNEALIKVTGVGICGTDLHILQVPPAHPAKKGIILGHEFSGEIVEVGSDIPDFEAGEAVLIDPHPGCGQCLECKQGNQDRCIPLYTTAEVGHPNTIGIFSDGAMTRYVVVPRQSLYKIKSGVPSHIAALAEPLSCVINAAKKIDVQPGQSVLILGAGPIGLLFTALLKAAGASKVIVSEPSEYRRLKAGECGADVTIDPMNEDLFKTVSNEINNGPDVVVEAVGPLLPDAIELVKPDGIVLQFGHDESVKPQIPVGTLLKKEVVIYGAFIGKHCFPTTATIMESGTLPLDKIVSHRLPLSKVHEGLELLRKQQAIKVILEPGDD